MTKAMILVAGLGTRARPLTEFYAKPALPLPGGSILTHILKQIKNEGIKDVALNPHYKPESILLALDECPVPDINVHLFPEPKITGSGGGFYRIRNFFENEPFLVVNGDSISEFDLGKMIKHYQQSDSLVTFLAEPCLNDEKKVLSSDKEGNVISIRKTPSPPKNAKKFYFRGTMMIDPEIFKHFPNKEHIDLIEDVLIPMLKSGKKMGEIYSPNLEWLDFGTPQDYFASAFLFLRKIFPLPKYQYLENHKYCDGFLVHSSTRISPKSVLERIGYVGPLCSIEGKCRLKDTIVFGDTTLNNINTEGAIIMSPSLQNENPPCNTIVLPNGKTITIARK